MEQAPSHSVLKERTSVPQRTIKQYHGPIYSQAEAEQLVAELRQRADCIDVRETACSVEAYFAVDAGTRTKLPGRCRVVPTPRYFPGDQAILLWHFPGAVSGNQVRIVHLSYVGDGYRYFVADQLTQASGWIDEEGLEPFQHLSERKAQDE